MSTPTAILSLAKFTRPYFINATDGDAVLYTSTSDQRIMFGRDTFQSLLSLNPKLSTADLNGTLTATTAISTSNLTSSNVLATSLSGSCNLIVGIAGASILDTQNYASQATVVVQGNISMISPNNTACNVYLTSYSGNLGVNLPSGSNPSYALTVNGDVYASQDILAFSDARLKTDILPITNALDKTLTLNGYTFNRIDDDCPERRRFVGLIAQEVEAVVPELVQTNKVDGFKCVAYGNLTAVLVEAIKELNSKLDSLRSEVDSMKTRLEHCK